MTDNNEPGALEIPWPTPEYGMATRGDIERIEEQLRAMHGMLTEILRHLDQMPHAVPRS